MATPHCQEDVSTIDVLDDNNLCLSRTKSLMKQFALEAMEFMLKNSGVWVEYPKDFLIRYDPVENCRVFTDDVIKATLTVSSIFRLEIKNGIRKLFSSLSDPHNFYRFLKSYSIPKGRYYFYNFLTWIAFVVSLTMFMYQEGYEFIEQALWCFKEYPDIPYFHSVGGWPAFHHFVGLMSSLIYDRMAAVIRKEVDDDPVISRFLNSIKAAERQERYFRKGWLLRMPDETRTDIVKLQISDKYGAAITLESNKIFPGCMKKLKNEFTDLKESPTKQSVKAVKVPTIKSMESDHEAVGEGKIEKKIILSGKVGQSKPHQFVKKYCLSPTASESTKCRATEKDVKEALENELRRLQEMKPAVFIISERYLTKRATTKRENPERKRVIKTFNPKCKSEHLSTHLTKIFDENLDKGNYTKICEGVLAVCPQGSHAGDASSRIIVVDTSSEEEDEENDYTVNELNSLFQCSFLIPFQSKNCAAEQSGSQDLSGKTPCDEEVMGPNNNADKQEVLSSKD